MARTRKSSKVHTYYLEGYEPFNEDDKLIITGSLKAGAAFLLTEAKYPRFIAHYSKSTPMDYLNFVRGILEKAGTEVSLTESKNCWVLQTKSHQVFVDLYNGWDRGYKLTNVNDLKDMTIEEFATWYSEGGMFKAGKAYINIGRFKLKEVEGLIKMMRDRFKLNTHLAKHLLPKETFLGVNTTMKFFDIVGPHLHPSMMHLAGKGYEWKPPVKE